MCQLLRFVGSVSDTTEFEHDHQLVDDVIGYRCAREPTQGWAVRGNYERRARRQSQKGASAIDRATPSFVKVLAGPYERGKTEQARERFLDMQTAIEAMNRAIEDEERSQGSVHAP